MMKKNDNYLIFISLKKKYRYYHDHHDLCHDQLYEKDKFLLSCMGMFYFVYVIVFIKRYDRYTFSSNHNIHKSSCGLCFWALDPLIDEIKASGTQKQSQHKLL